MGYHVVVDPITFWTLFFTVVGAVAAVAAAIFGAWALYYAKRGPSREDLQRVEQNTAETAKHVDAVREHTAATEVHLAIQEKQAALSSRAALVSIAASGSGSSGLPLDVKFSITDSDFRLRRIDMLNRRGNPIGTRICREEAPSTFSVTLGVDVIEKWVNEGDVLGPVNYLAVSLRAYLEINGEETSKVISIQILRPSDWSRQPTSPIYVSGGC